MSLSEKILIKAESYLDDTLNEEDKINFELELSNNDELKEYLALSKELRIQYNDMSWQFLIKQQIKRGDNLSDYLKSEEVKNIKESISNVNKVFNNKNKPFTRRKWYMYSSAALIALLISVYIINHQNKSYEEIYYYNINKVEIPSAINRGSKDDFEKIILGQNYFNNKEYLKVINIFSKELKQDNQNSIIYLCSAISQMELNQFQEAERTLNFLLNSDSIDSEKGYWLKSLLYIKSKKFKKARETLSIIIKNSYYNHKKAKVLLEDINDF